MPALFARLGRPILRAAPTSARKERRRALRPERSSEGVGLAIAEVLKRVALNSGGGESPEIPIAGGNPARAMRLALRAQAAVNAIGTPAAEPFVAPPQPPPPVAVAPAPAPEAVTPAPAERRPKSRTRKKVVTRTRGVGGRAAERDARAREKAPARRAHCRPQRSWNRRLHQPSPRQRPNRPRGRRPHRRAVRAVRCRSRPGRTPSSTTRRRRRVASTSAGSGVACSEFQPRWHWSSTRTAPRSTGCSSRRVTISCRISSSHSPAGHRSRGQGGRRASRAQASARRGSWRGESPRPAGLRPRCAGPARDRRALSQMGTRASDTAVTWMSAGRMRAAMASTRGEIALARPVGLHGEHDQVDDADRPGVVLGRDLCDEGAERRALHLQPAPADGGQVQAAGHNGHVLAGKRQPRPEVAADPSRPNDRDAHGCSRRRPTSGSPGRVGSIAAAGQAPTKAAEPPPSRLRLS